MRWISVLTRGRAASQTMRSIWHLARHYPACTIGAGVVAAASASPGTACCVPRINHQDALDKPATDRSMRELPWTCVDSMTEKSKSCRFCTMQYSGGPNRIIPHIIKACANTVEGLQDEFRAIRDRFLEDKAANDASSAALHSHAQAVAHASNRSVHLTLSEKSLHSDKAVDAQWMRAFASAGIAFNVAADPEFRKAVLMTAQRGKAYTRVVTPSGPSLQYVDSKLPGKRKLSTTLLDSCYKSVTEDVAQLKKIMATVGASITSDGWSDVNNRPLLNILVVTVAGSFFIKAINTEGNTKDKEYIARVIIEAIRADGPGNVVLVVMDGACRASFPIIEKEFPHVICLCCGPHSLDLFLEDICKEGSQGPQGNTFDEDTTFMREVIAEVRAILKFITNHQKPLAFFRRIVSKFPPGLGGRELLKPGDTRFGSNFIAMQVRGLRSQTPRQVTIERQITEPPTPPRPSCIPGITTPLLLCSACSIYVPSWRSSW